MLGGKKAPTILEISKYFMEADQKSLRGLKVKKAIFSAILNNFAEKFEKQLFSWVFLHEIWHFYRTEGALSNDTKFIPIGHCLQGQYHGHYLSFIYDLGCDLESKIQFG